MTADETEKLALRMSQLDETAVREFSREFGPRLWRYFLRRGVSVSESESLAVSCISDVWLKLDRFTSQGRGSFEAWVFTLARNALADERRGEWAGAQALADVPIQSDATTDDEPAVTTSPLGWVYEALATLHDIDQAIIRLRHFEGELSFAQIGRELNLSENATRVRHHRAMRALEARLGPLAPQSLSSPSIQKGDPS